jgi:hypothetical protein
VFLLVLLLSGRCEYSSAFAELNTFGLDFFGTIFRVIYYLLVVCIQYRLSMLDFWDHVTF